MKCLFLIPLLAGFALSAAVVPVPEKVPCAIADKQDFTLPDRVHLTDWIGSRIDVNESNRLVELDVNRLLEGYRKRPGRQSYDGEHVGKWLHAATLAWINTGDPALRKKLDYVADELVKCQLHDGYLGTYLDKDRWTEWDVWSHKYNLIGLLTYVRYTGNMEPLEACRKMGDLLCATFGDEPGKRDIIKAGWHVGLAPTSVMEPMVLLYRMTGETRYLDFCKYILRAWEQPDGPKIVSTLLTKKRVDKVGNGKAYEMLSCLNGALEYYRTVGGDRQILDACLNAWQDIVKNRLYITGAASHGELFHDNYDLPNVANVGETCVTVTWEQFNAQLLRLTGEARFAEQLEHAVLNQLFGAQKCDGTAWGYYVQMEGKKPYSADLDGHCCLSSGPRGIALIPTFALSTDADGAVVNLYNTGTADLTLRDGTGVKITTDTMYPSDGRIHIKVDPAQSKTFAVKLRIPAWCRNSSIEVNGRQVKERTGADGYVALKRHWKPGDTIELNLKLEPSLVIGDHMNQGKGAVLYGPLVLAADGALLTDTGETLRDVVLAGSDLAALDVKPEPAPDKVKTWSGSQVFSLNAVAKKRAGDATPGSVRIRLIPFADAGGTGSLYRVWLPLVNAKSENLLRFGNESRSREGNANGSITSDFDSLVVTFDGQPASKDWYAVTVDEGVQADRIVFAHGKNYHDGGWFDTSQEKPVVQIQTTKDGEWQTVGELSDYPATTATSHRGLHDGQRFTLRLQAPTTLFGVRVEGRPASGDNPKQAFSSCAGLQALAAEH
ncbi:MAG TPA: beta-L-arabinofuranosidase domain-containing protein [Verrucomicrobiae bacterium]|jgi:hypothetical protein|nr:beta-L-arabinofuranosidase domain-containing protein [Verrucomicrobiae bacterium]